MRREYRVQLYFLIPIVFTGLCLLALMGAYEITRHMSGNGQEPLRFIIYWAFGIVSLCAAVSILVARRIIHPLERFVDRMEARGLGCEQQGHFPEAGKQGVGSNEFTRVDHFFDQVGQMLDVLEAQELFPSIIGQSAAMRGVMAQIKRVSRADATVLLLGESGVGKDLLAHAIHDMSARRAKPMISINCAAIPHGLLESELFGHEKGAFTGAHARKPGKFELAHSGTLFLDEIGDMPLEIQAKLLRVIEEKSFERVGGTETIHTDIRIIAATNQDLHARMAEGLFREDLYYRINVFHIFVPPLREREGDAVLLARHFLASGGYECSFDQEVLERIAQHPWPGNVRELANAVERAALLADGVIQVRHLPPELRRAVVGSTKNSKVDADSSTAGESAAPLPFTGSLDDHLARMEKDMIQRALAQSGGIQVRAAELLGIKERSLWHRVKKHDILIKKVPSTNNGG